jgi:RNA polymerase sigma factor (sigma-70 family)
MVLGVCQRMLHNTHDVEDAFQATFLVLVRKARSVNPRNLVGHWLYGVAYRTALRAKSLDVKRREKEKAMPCSADSPSDSWQDVRPLLDAELNGLPEKYRIPVVLCDLEGKSRKEVAAELGCAEGTLSSRLARARALLARRLSRRGVTLSGEALAALVAANGASACVPASLFSSTLKAAMLLMAGRALTAACTSLKAAALAEGLGETMLFANLKLTALWCGVAVLGIGTGGVLYQTRAAVVDSTKQEPARAQGGLLARLDDSKPETAPQKEEVGQAPSGDIAERLSAYETAVKDIEAKAAADIRALQDKLIRELEAQLESDTKVGKLDAAIALRDRIRVLKAARQKSHELAVHAKEKTRNLLVNGSFEEGPPLPENGVHVVPFPAGSTAIKGWVVTRPGGGVWDYTYFQPLDGKRMGGVAGRHGDHPGGGAISQTFESRKGQKYRLSFWLAGDAITQHGEKRLKVSAAGKVAEFVFDTRGKTRQDMGWARKTWVFTAEANETTLEFSCLSEGMFGGVALDDVVVVPVDE